MTGPIVACIDDSQHALSAARVARKLAESLGLDLVLAHAAQPLTEPGISVVPGGPARLAAEERQEADELLSRVASELELPPSVERRVLFGPPAPSLLAFCSEREAAMVVLGSRGRGGVKAALLGSVSGAVAGKADCIVVVVPPGTAARLS
jgi:nucleotide-binding universal stress UspA family protein